MRYVALHAGDCREVLFDMAVNGNVFDACVTDPPYHLTSVTKRFGAVNAAPAKHGTDGLYARQSAGFMGKQWDGGDIAFRPETWRAVFDVLKPGAFLAAFGGTRTFYRMAVAIEDAGFEVRDTMAWLYGTGFPKSHNVSRVIDKHLGAEGTFTPIGEYQPATAEAAAWTGWGTALKPGWEPIILARKPLAGTIAANVLAHGVGGLNVDACRVGTDGGTTGRGSSESSNHAFGDGLNGWSVQAIPGLGRWPANVLHDGSNEVLDAFGGTAARFFYCAKATKADRAGSKHPTVKPLALIRWLTTLITPPGGRVLDPFAGSGTTLQAAFDLGMRADGIEREPEYQADIQRRIEAMESLYA